MDKFLVGNLIKIVKENNINKKVIKSVGNTFLSEGYNRATAKKVFGDSNLINTLNPRNELILFTKALYTATHRDEINPDKVFTKEELEFFELQQTTKNIEFMPDNSNNLNERELRKVEYLNTKYGNINSKKHLYYTYFTNIKDFEDSLNKDLCHFTKFEIIELMDGVVNSIQLKQAVLSFIKGYINYCVEVGYTDINIIDTIDETKENEKLIRVKDEMAENIFIDITELEKDLNRLVASGANNIHPIDAMIVMLARHGISLREIIELRNSDFDFENKTVNIKYNDKIKRVKLSDETLKWVKEAKDSPAKAQGSSHYLKTIDDHIVKITTDVYDEKKVLPLVRKRLTKFAECGYRALTEKMLVNSRKIDALEMILDKKGELTVNDFKAVQKLFGNSESSYYLLKTDWQLLKGDEGIKYMINNVGRKLGM